jgi:hypothetical protein
MKENTEKKASAFLVRYRTEEEPQEIPLRIDGLPVVALPYPEPTFGLFELPDPLGHSIDCSQPVSDEVYQEIFMLHPEIEAIFVLVSGTILVELCKLSDSDAALRKCTFPDVIGGLDVIILPAGALRASCSGAGHDPMPSEPLPSDPRMPGESIQYRSPLFPMNSPVSSCGLSVLVGETEYLTVSTHSFCIPKMEDNRSGFLNKIKSLFLAEADYKPGEEVWWLGGAKVCLRSTY